MGHDLSEDSERRYRQLIETSPAPINLFDSAGETIWGNDAVVDLLDLDSRAELIGRSIFDFISTDDRFTAERELVAVVEEKIPTGPTNMNLRTADGETRNIRVATAPGRYKGQDIGQAVIIDVTSLNEAQASLALEKRFIQDALDTLEDVFYVLDIGGELVRWNSPLLDVTGYSEREVREMTIEDFFVAADVRRVSESIATAFAEGEDVLEATVVTKRGDRIPYEFRKRRLTWNDEVAGLVGIGRDISERRARDQYLRNIDKLLQHSLRNQLNVVQGHVEQLRDEPVDELEHVEKIAAAAEKLHSTFEKHHHITDFVTTEQAPSRVDVVPILAEIVRTSREAHPSMAITSDLPEELTIWAVRGIKQALEELVTNAISHNDHAEPTVGIVVEARDATCVLHVRDNGPPISEMDRKVVTGEQTVSSTYHSEGLGLWFVYWIVTRSGGSLSFSHKRPRGNVITVEFVRPESYRRESVGP